MVLTILLLILTGSFHPLAIATAMNFALRAGEAANLVLSCFAVGVTATLVIFQRGAIRPLAWLQGRA